MGINDRPSPFKGRSDLETLMASPFDRVGEGLFGFVLPETRVDVHVQHACVGASTSSCF